MVKRRWYLAAVVALTMADTQPVEAAWDQLAHHKNRVAEIRRNVKATSGATTNVVVMLGDSLTEKIPRDQLGGMPIANHGVSGDRTFNPETGTGVLPRIDLVQKYQPSHVFVMIGVNDLRAAGSNVTSIEQQWRKLAKELRAAVPDAKIYVQTVLPVGGPEASVQAKVDELNRKLPAIAHEIKAQLVLLDPVMKGADGFIRPKYTDDGVHLTPAGYKAWLDELERRLQQPD